ncbi:MAG: type VI secretion system accessory protein TagJ [Pseudomonadota bacterium]
MTEIRDLLAAANLDGLRAVAIADVQKAPADARARTFLFQVLLVEGDYDRALKHLRVARDLDAAAIPMEQAYTPLIQGDALREKVFEGAHTPALLGEPVPWIAYLFEALKADAAGDPARAFELRETAFEGSPMTSGTLNGEPFEWFADADNRLGPVLELFANGVYYWAPFERIMSITIEPPEDLRDFVFAPVHVELTNGGELFGFVPTRYPGASAQPDPSIKLARRTEWSPLHEEHHAGHGQRLMITEENEVPLLDIRELKLNNERLGASASAEEILGTSEGDGATMVDAEISLSSTERT